MSDEEEWRDVVGYEGLYSVNRQGLIVSHRRDKRYRNGRPREMGDYVLTASLDPGTSTQLFLTKDGEARIHNLRRIVFEAFIGPVPEGHFVQSKREAPKSVAVDDLELTTFAACSMNEYRKHEASNRAAQARSLRKKGLSHREIGKIVGCNDRSVSRYLRDEQSVVTSEGLDRRHLAGLSAKQAAKDAGVSDKTVHRVIASIESGGIVEGQRSATIKLLLWMHANRERMEAST